jgi:lipoprotein Spr
MRLLDKTFFFYFFISSSLFLAFSSCRTSREISGSKKEAVESSVTQKKFSALLNVPAEKLSNSALYSFIEEWYGVPYKYGGNNKKGIDCSNFTAALFKKVYDKTVTGSSASLFDQCKVIPKKELKEGDLVFFKIENKNVSHVGIYLQNNKFVHATTKKGVMIDDLDEDYYKKYFYKAGRLIN